MALPAIVYYGPTGLGSDTFLAYMQSAGYSTRQLYTPTLDPALSQQEGSFVVVALDCPPEEVASFVRELYRCHSAAIRQIFVVSEKRLKLPKAPVIQQIAPPNYLTEVARRIHALTRPAA